MSTERTCKGCGVTIWQEPDKALDGTYAVVWASEEGWICAETGNEHAPDAEDSTYQRDLDAITEGLFPEAVRHDDAVWNGLVEHLENLGHSRARIERDLHTWADEDDDHKPALDADLIADVFVITEEDETWKVTYPEKPEWWDDPTEPRCDVCGVHTEEACVYVKDPDVDLDRYPGAWCGECGNCADHCTCDDNPMDPLEALTYAILAINTDQAPDATSGNDLLYLELNAERALTALAALRDMLGSE